MLWVYFVAESGGPSILIACDILASGSIKGFITGKHYNRCKRIHPLLASAMELLHFKFFLSRVGTNNSDILNLVREEISQIFNDSSSIHNTDFDGTSLSKEMKELLEDYEKFKDKTRRGEVF